MAIPYTHPLDDADFAAVFEPRVCANCGDPIPSFKRWCSPRCWRREDEGR